MRHGFFRREEFTIYLRFSTVRSYIHKKKLPYALTAIVQPFGPLDPIRVISPHIGFFPFIFTFQSDHLFSHPSITDGGMLPVGRFCARN
jgi:hypothetical protein